MVKVGLGSVELTGDRLPDTEGHPVFKTGDTGLEDVQVGLEAVEFRFGRLHLHLLVLSLLVLVTISEPKVESVLEGFVREGTLLHDARGGRGECGGNAQILKITSCD